MELAVKRMLIGTRIGRAAMLVRDNFRLLLSPRVEFGTVVNDQIAVRLAVGFCPPRGTFVDVGAHIGSVTSEVHFMRPEAKVIAFEAIPEKAAGLRRKFPDVEVHNFALWDSEGESSFFIDDEKSSCSSLERGASRSREIKVQTRTLDQLMAGRALDVLKIDVEGAELAVLRGASEVIDRERPIVMFESGPEVRFGFTKEAMYDFFAARNYGLFAPNRLAHTGKPMSLDGFLDSHEYPRRTTNYFALPREGESDIRQAARAIKL